MRQGLKRWMTAAAMLGGLSMAAGGAWAQSYPMDTVKLVTHSKAGGGTDVFLREMVKHLGPIMGVNFVVENVRGGSGAKAMALLATSPADGSIFYGTTPTFINTSILSKPEYTYQNLEPVVNVFLDPQIVYVRADSPYNSLGEIVEKAKADPTSVKFGVTTPGSLDRQVMEKLKALAGGIDDTPIITHDGGGELLLDVLNGTVDVGIGEIQELLGQLEANQVRVITTYTRERLEEFPDAPTALEQGLDLVIDKFRGIAGPKGLPPEIIDAWQTGVQKVLEDPAFKEWYTAASLTPAYMSHDDYGPFIDRFAEGQREFFVKYGITED